jgi:heat shock protein HslJ
MDEAERAFRDALRRVDTMTLPAHLDPVEFRASRPARRFPVRWLATAAALALAAGLAFWAVAGRGSTVPAVPASTPAATAGNPLLGAWIATELGGADVVPAGSKVPYVRFEDDNSFSGGDPCNGVDGVYTLDGDRVRITRIGFGTLIGCLPNQQNAFTTALADARRVQRDGTTLRLLDASGEPLATFERTEGNLAPSPNPSRFANIARIRVSNGGAVDFDDVTVQFPGLTGRADEWTIGGTTIDYGRVPAGSSSFYGYSGTAVYRYAQVEVSAGGKVYRFQPGDYVGEKRLKPGRYTYVLTLEGERVDLRLTKDD